MGLLSKTMKGTGHDVVGGDAQPKKPFPRQPVRWVIAFALLGLLAVGIGGVWAIGAGYGLSDLREWLELLLEWLRDRPVLFLLAFAILPGLGAPVSPLMIAAGAVGIPRFGILWTCVAVWGAIMVCTIWNYWVARSGFREWVGRLLVKRQKALPEGTSGNFTILAILVRLTPGIPLFVQNYFLGFMRMPFIRYGVITAVTQAFYVPAYVIGGGAIIEGRTKLLLLALSMIVLFGGIAYIVRHRLEKNSIS